MNEDESAGCGLPVMTRGPEPRSFITATGGECRLDVKATEGRYLAERYGNVVFTRAERLAAGFYRTRQLENLAKAGAAQLAQPAFRKTNVTRTRFTDRLPRR